MGKAPGGRGCRRRTPPKSSPGQKAKKRGETFLQAKGLFLGVSVEGHASLHTHTPRGGLPRGAPTHSSTVTIMGSEWLGKNSHCGTVWLLSNLFLGILMISALLAAPTFFWGGDIGGSFEKILSKRFPKNGIFRPPKFRHHKLFLGSGTVKYPHSWGGARTLIVIFFWVCVLFSVFYISMIFGGFPQG